MHLGYHGNGRHFELFSTPQKLPHTTVDIPTKFHEVWWKESKNILNHPLFCFHGNCGKVCPIVFDLFSLSRSTRCGCCSYQVSSISVWRVTSYDHFCVFHFCFCILAVSMATAVILKNQPIKAKLHMAYDIPTRFHKVWSRHLREICRTNFWRKKERKKERKKKIETEQTQYVYQTSLGGHNDPSWLSSGTSIKSDGVKLVYSRFF